MRNQKTVTTVSNNSIVRLFGRPESKTQDAIRNLPKTNRISNAYLTFTCLAFRHRYWADAADVASSRKNPKRAHAIDRTYVGIELKKESLISSFIIALGVFVYVAKSLCSWMYILYTLGRWATGWVEKVRLSKMGHGVYHRFYDTRM